MTSTLHDGSQTFTWGLVLIVLGLSLLPVTCFIVNHWNRWEDAFPWLLRVSVLCDAVGAGLILSCNGRLWLRMGLSVIAIAGALTWFFAAFAML